MYARLSDELIDHRKIFVAGEAIGKNGPALAIGVYALGLMWANKQLTDGLLPNAVVRSFSRYVADPKLIADALTKAGLWEKNGDGFKIHDYHEYGNPSAAHVLKRRRAEQQRKHRARGKTGKKR